MEQIDYFRGPYGFLSNFHDCSIQYEGLWYKNAEAAFQSAKTDDVNERLPFMNYSGREAKKEGRKVTLRSDWNNIRINVMYEICKAKFKDNYELRCKLSDTYPKQLIEGNTWGDTFWGCVSDGKGSNFLGRILMIIRDEIIEEDSGDISETQKDILDHDGY